MQMKGRKTVAISLLLFVSMLCLYAVETTSVEYEMYMMREVQGTLGAVYFAGLDGTPLGNNAYYAIDMEKTADQIQFLIAVENNYASTASVSPKISLKFEQFKYTNLNGSPFRGGYVVNMWKYEPVTIPVETGRNANDEPVYTDWTFQKQPSTALQPLTYDGYSGAVQRSTRDKATKITGNSTGTNSSSSITWSVEKTNHPLQETRTWYYGIGLQFTGTYTGQDNYGNLDFLRSYPPGGEFAATITLTVSGT